MNSDEVQRYPKTRVLHVGKVNYNVSQSVLFSLLKTQFHAHRPRFFLDNPAFSSVSITTRSGLRLFTWRFDDDSSPKFQLILDVPFSDDLTSALGVLQSCFPQSDLIGIYRWSLPVFYVVILIFSCATLSSAPTPTWFILVPTFASFVSTYLWFRSVD